MGEVIDGTALTVGIAEGCVVEPGDGKKLTAVGKMLDKAVLKPEEDKLVLSPSIRNPVILNKKIFGPHYNICIRFSRQKRTQFQRALHNLIWSLAYTESILFAPN